MMHLMLCFSQSYLKGYLVTLQMLIFSMHSFLLMVQSAALMSVGLLYEGSAHPQTMQILLVCNFLSLLC